MGDFYFRSNKAEVVGGSCGNLRCDNVYDWWLSYGHPQCNGSQSFLYVPPSPNSEYYFVGYPVLA